MDRLDPDLRSLQEVRDLVERASAAAKAVRQYSQGEIDTLCAAMAQAGAAAAHDLGRIAVEETGIGRIHYKILKNLFGSQGIWESIEKERTVGILSRDERTGVVEVATPVGVVAAIIPTTNPTSTALGKALIAVKGRNAIVISPHPRARRCIFETAEVLRRAIERAGGPPDLVTCLSNPTIESTGALMKHKKVSIILATGGSGLVKAAYSSGKPAYGVGPGNVPCYVDRSADVGEAARWVTASQSFDNATLCCSEQGAILDRPIADRWLAEMTSRGAHLCSDAEVERLSAHCNRGGHMNPDVVGLDPWRIAEQAGFSVPRHTTVLLAPQGGTGKEWPLAIEILCPLLSVHVVDGWEEGCRESMAMLHRGGLGHTLGVWARDERVLDAWFLEKPASRIVVNGPTSQGAVGYSTGLVPSMSLGCGPQAGNITSDNITARHLINVKRASGPRRDWDEIYVRDHARAAEWTGDVAPRGSGLPGDPALGGGGASLASRSALTDDGGSNWRGNPAVIPQPSPTAAPAFPRPGGGGASGPATGGAPRAKVTAAEKTRPAGSCRSNTAAPGQGRSAGAPPGGDRPASRPAAPRFTAPAGSGGTPSTPRPAAPTAKARGGVLSPNDIQSILSHAGSGCPLGPCQGCPHQDVRTGACNA